MNTQDIKGFKELQRRLNKLKDPRKAKNIMRSGMRQGAKAIAQEAERILVGATGSHNRKKIGYESKRGDRNSLIMKVGPLKQNWELNFLEYGVPPHIIKPRKKALAIYAEEGGFGWTLFKSFVNHPGVPKVAFLRKAVDGDTRYVLDAIRGQVKKRLDKEARR